MSRIAEWLQLGQFIGLNSPFPLQYIFSHSSPMGSKGVDGFECHPHILCTSLLFQWNGTPGSYGSPNQVRWQEERPAAVLCSQCHLSVNQLLTDHDTLSFATDNERMWMNVLVSCCFLIMWPNSPWLSHFFNSAVRMKCIPLHKEFITGK